ncbi:MAG: ABC transporter ATP-binding protein [Actinomycetota bacterium]|nr:ABC transporter ATP-binding protein [Actinomycetota bacterium]
MSDREPSGDEPAAARAAIELDDVERRYGERVALSEVTVRLAAGQTLAVLGSNGAGKTTLLRVLATLLRPHAGTARVLGHELPGEAWKVRGGIGYLGHDPLLYRELTGRENLRYHAQLHGLGRRGGSDVGFASPGRLNPTSAVRERVEERLAAVGMTRRADEPVRDLSKGMVQRLAVARATLHDPELLLLDEPRANLDPAAAEALEPLIGRASGKTRVLVTHDVEGGLAEADVALGLRGGKQAFCRPAAEVDAATARGLYS